MRTLIALLPTVLALPFNANCQQKNALSFGLQFSVFKQIQPQYPTDALKVRNLGAVPLNNEQTNVFTANDLELYVRSERKRRYWEVGAGLGADAYNINKEGEIFGGIGSSGHPVIITNSTVRVHIAGGYLITGKRVLHLYIRPGIAYDVAQLKSDYNPLNALFGRLTNSNSINNLLGEPLKIPATEGFALPRTTAGLGLEGVIRRFSITVSYEYRSKIFDIGQQDKVYLIDHATQLKVMLSVLLRKKYKSFKP